LSGNTNIIKRNPEGMFQTSTEVGMETNTGKSKYVVKSRQHYVGQK